MSDLISRKATIQRFIQEIEDSGSNVIHINTIKRVLQDIETAYDVDSVVEEMKKASKPLGIGLMPDSRYIREEKAIEIVKAGGKV